MNVAIVKFNNDQRIVALLVTTEKKSPANLRPLQAKKSNPVSYLVIIPSVHVKWGHHDGAERKSYRSTAPLISINVVAM